MVQPERKTSPAAQSPRLVVPTHYAAGLATAIPIALVDRRPVRPLHVPGRGMDATLRREGRMMLLARWFLCCLKWSGLVVMGTVAVAATLVVAVLFFGAIVLLALCSRDFRDLLRRRWQPQSEQS